MLAFGSAAPVARTIDQRLVELERAMRVMLARPVEESSPPPREPARRVTVELDPEWAWVAGIAAAWILGAVRRQAWLCDCAVLVGFWRWVA